MSIATIHETIRLIRNPNRVAELALEYAHHSTSESRHWDKLANILARRVVLLDGTIIREWATTEAHNAETCRDPACDCMPF